MPNRFAEIRQQFPVTANRIYLNNAAVAPLPPFISSEARNILAGYAAVGGDLEGQWHKRIAEIRGILGLLVGAAADEIFFTKNTSEGLTFAARGIRWQAGDNAVSLRGEFPAVTVPLSLLDDEGVELRIVEPRPDNSFAVDDVLAAIDGRTRLLTVSFVEFHTGARNDLVKLGEICRERGVFFAVDGVQGVGALFSRVKEWNADLVSVGGHKWMIGGEGVAFCAVNLEKLDQLRPVGESWLSVEEPLEFLTGGLEPARFDKPLARDARRFEGGTLNIAGIHMLGKSAEAMLRLGPEKIERHILGLGERLFEGLTRLGYEVVSPQAEETRSGITCFRPGRGDARQLLKSLRDKNFSLGFPCGAIRVSPHYYNNEEDIDALLEALAG